MSALNMRIAILIAISLASVISLFFVGPIPQDPAYHLFADSQAVFGIANFWNVASNAPFLIAGIIGLLRYKTLAHVDSANGYLLICIGAFLVGLGSGYYHYAPSNASLLWDRLPMTIAFMALFSLLLGERVLQKHNPLVLWALISAGAASVFYWSWTESLGAGDLRFYALIQFLPIILMPLILFMFKQQHMNTKLLFWAFVLYLVAKAFEHFDAQVLSIFGIMSGHAIKHVVAAAAILCIIYAVPTRRSSSP